MPRSRVQTYVLAATQADLALADTTIDGILKLQGNKIFDYPVKWTAEPALDGGYEAEVDVRFTDETAAQAVYDALAQSVQLQQLGLTGSSTSLHQCPHGDGLVYNCRQTPEAQYTEVAL